MSTEAERAVRHGGLWYCNDKRRVMGMIRATQLFLLILAGMQLNPALAETTLQKLEWPAASQFRACVSLQFGVLEMTLPPGIVGKLFVATADGPVIHIMPVGARDSRTGAALLWRSREDYLAPYRALNLPAAAQSNPEEFFDMLGQVGPLTEPVVRAKTVEDRQGCTLHESVEGTPAGLPHRGQRYEHQLSPRRSARQ